MSFGTIRSILESEVYEMEYLFIYLLQMFYYIDIIKGVFFFLLIAGIIGFIILGFLTGFQYENHKQDGFCQITQNVAKSATKFFKNIIITFGILFLITAFVPSRQTLLFIGGTYLGKKAVKQVVTDEKIKKIDTIINLELDKKIKELKGAN